MKKTALLALIATMMITSSACSSQQSAAQAAPNSTDDTTTVSAEQNEKPDEPVVEVNYVAPMAPTVEATEPDQFEGLQEMQKITDEDRKMFEAMINGDFSDVAGVYNLDKAIAGTYELSGDTTMTISESGEMTLSEYTDYLGVTYRNLVFTPGYLNEEQRQQAIKDMKTGSNQLRSLVWSIEYSPEYGANTNGTGSKPMSFSLPITYYPVGSEIAAWVKSNGGISYSGSTMPSDTSRKRFILSSGYFDGMEDLTPVFTQRDDEVWAREMEEEMSEPSPEQLEAAKTTGGESYYPEWDPRHSPEETTGTEATETSFVSIFADDWPNGYKRFSDSNVEVVYENSEGNITVELMDEIETSDGFTFFGARVSTYKYKVDPMQQDAPVEFIGQKDMAMMHAQATGLGFTSKLADYLRELMSE